MSAPLDSRPPLLYLSSEDVRRALPMASAMDAVRRGFRDLAEGTVTMPARTMISSASGDEVSLIMPSRGASLGRLAVKLITLYERNRAAGLPLAHALVVLADGPTGVPLAVLDGGALTALRTGAVSGVATAALARHEAAVAAVVGAGRQGRAQLAAVSLARSLREVRVFDADAKAAVRFAREMSAELTLEIRAVPDAGAAVRGADIVCTATNSKEPVFADADVGPGTHINAVGVYQPERAEIPAATVARARIVVDMTEAALEEAGDLLRPLAAGLIEPGRLRTELGEVLLGRAEGRRSAAEVTLFKSVGLAVQDLYAAAEAYDRAVREGLGTPLPR